MVYFRDVPDSPLRELLIKRAPLAAIQQAYEANPDHWDWTLCQAWLSSRHCIPKTGVLGFLLPRLPRSFEGKEDIQYLFDAGFEKCFKWGILSANNTEESEQDGSLPAEEEFKSLVDLCGDFLEFWQGKEPVFGESILKSAFENNFSVELLKMLCQMFADKYYCCPNVPLTSLVRQDVFEAIQPLLNNQKNGRHWNDIRINIIHWDSPALIPFLSRAMQASSPYEKRLNVTLPEGPDTMNVNDQVASIQVTPICGFKGLLVDGRKSDRCDGFLALAERMPRLEIAFLALPANWEAATGGKLAPLINNSPHLENFGVWCPTMTHEGLGELLKQLAGPLKTSQSINSLGFINKTRLSSCEGAKNVLELVTDILRGNDKIKKFDLLPEYYSRTEPKNMESSEMEFARGLNIIRPCLPLPAVEDDSFQATINILSHLGNNRKYCLTGDAHAHCLTGQAREDLFVSLRFYILKELVPYWNGCHIEPEVVNVAATSRGEHEGEANHVVI